MDGPLGQHVAYCGSDPTWEFLARALAERRVVLRRYPDNQPHLWTTGRFELVIIDVATEDGDALERLRRVSRWCGGAPVLVLYGLEAGAQAMAARMGGHEGVVVRRWLPGLPGEEQMLARFVEALLDASPAACMRMILSHALGRNVESGAAFASVVVDRLAAGKGLPRTEGSRVVGVRKLAAEAGISLRSLEETLRPTDLPSPVGLAGLVAVLYTALLACSRNRSLEWAAGQAGLSPERLRRWRRGLGLPPGLLPEEVVVTALRALAHRCGLPSTQLTAVARNVTPFLESRAQAAGA
jgi:hypothetical protein